MPFEEAARPWIRPRHRYARTRSARHACQGATHRGERAAQEVPERYARQRRKPLREPQAGAAAAAAAGSCGASSTARALLLLLGCPPRLEAGLEAGAGRVVEGAGGSDRIGAQGAAKEHVRGAPHACAAAVLQDAHGTS